MKEKEEERIYSQSPHHQNKKKSADLRGGRESIFFFLMEKEKLILFKRIHLTILNYAEFFIKCFYFLVYKLFNHSE